MPAVSHEQNRIAFRQLWNVHGSIGRLPFLFWGFLFGVLKYNMDRLIALVTFERSWLFWNYFEPSSEYPLRNLPAEDRTFFVVIALTALPFMAVGLILTLQRLRSAGLPLWLVVLFFVPLINLLFFLVLALLPAKIGGHVSGRESKSAFLQRIVPESPAGRAFFSIGVSLPIGIAAVLLAVYAFEDYGWGIFLGLPFILGLFAPLIYGYGRGAGIGACLLLATGANVAVMVGLLAFAIEGIICILMAVPIGIIPAMLGGVVAYAILQVSNANPQATGVACFLFLCLPGMMGFENQRKSEPILFEVVSEVVIEAPPREIWPHMIAFSEIPEPDGLLFRLGIAYPVKAELRGSGVGAVRHCVFSTGPFVEPITAWEEEKRIAFDVIAQPHPMDELSPYRNLEPPHLHDYFRSQRGELRLEPAPGGKTRLVGTTWYEHEVWPTAYWRLWSDAIIHRIHLRVLVHIKALSEAKAW